MGRGKGYVASTTSSRAVDRSLKLNQTCLAVFLGLDILGGPAHAADLSGFKEDTVLWAIEGHGLGHVHAASLDVP